MPLLTLTTDFGYKDWYLSGLKGLLYNKIQGFEMIDVTHGIGLNNVIQAAYTIQGVLTCYPPGTIHLVAVGQQKTAHVAVVIKVQDQWVLSGDTGLHALLRDVQEVRTMTFDQAIESPFFALDILVPALKKFISEGESKLDSGMELLEKKMPECHYGEDTFRGVVQYIDEQGNLTTNYQQAEFLQALNGRKFQIDLGYDEINRISSTYSDKPPGDCLALFNHLGYMEISIVQGNAAQLFGARFGTSIITKVVG